MTIGQAKARKSRGKSVAKFSPHPGPAREWPAKGRISGASEMGKPFRSRRALGSDAIKVAETAFRYVRVFLPIVRHIELHLGRPLRRRGNLDRDQYE